MGNRDALWRHVDIRAARSLALPDRVRAVPELCYTEVRSARVLTNEDLRATAATDLYARVGAEGYRSPLGMLVA